MGSEGVEVSASKRADADADADTDADTDAADAVDPCMQCHSHTCDVSVVITPSSVVIVWDMSRYGMDALVHLYRRLHM